MAYRVLPRRLKKLGYCCIFAYLTDREEYFTSQITDELLTHKRTARRWRSKFNNGELSCENNLNCCRKERGQRLDSAAEEIDLSDQPQASEPDADLPE